MGSATPGMEKPMPDDTSNRGAQDRARVASDEGYEVRHFAERHRISEQEAQRLIEQHGNNRQELDEAAQALRGRQTS